jgi:branched-chain amino acid aminotransferase
MYINGRIMPAREAVISVLDRGLLYGDGIFETIRVYAGKPFMLDAHLARMAEGCSVIALPMPDVEGIKRGVVQVLKANGLFDAYLRITVTRGPTGGLWYDLDRSSPTVVIMTKPFAPRDFGEGLSLIVSSARSDEESPLSRIKHTGILWKMLARAEAKRAGADDALMLDTKGHVSEATSANVFWVRGGALYTPSLDCGILPGITRAVVIDIAREQGTAVREGKFPPDDLLAADEAFLTSSTWELAQIGSIAGKEFRTSRPITKTLTEEYKLRTLP